MNHTLIVGKYLGSNMGTPPILLNEKLAEILMKHILINKFACTAANNEPSAQNNLLANFPILL